MKRKIIKAIMGLVLSAAIFTSGITGVYAESAEAVEAEADEMVVDTAETVEDAESDGAETAEYNADADDSVESDDVFETEVEFETETDNEKPYLVLGENLKEKDKKEVLKLLGVDEDEIDEYNILTVSNEEEHYYLDEYVEKSKIGTKALSSIVIRAAEKGDGLNFNIYNIDYCTVGMYKNVCTTVGIKDADITIAGPFKISGTAALIGIIKAYEEMTGENVSDALADAAMNELIVTGDLEGSIDGEPETVEAFMADLKAQMQNLKSEKDIRTAIKETASKYNLSLSETDIENIYYLLNKLKDLNLDWDFIEKQANDLAELWDSGDMNGFWASIVNFFKELLKSLKGLFS